MLCTKNDCCVCVQFVPDDCTEVAEVGDEVSVHYTVSIADVMKSMQSLQSVQKRFGFSALLLCSDVEVTTYML